jgi:formate dehydrogenase subunit gamma
MIERYNFAERIVHWIAGVTYVYLLLTGLAFFSPTMWWIATLLGGGPVIRYWHPIAGLVFAATVIWMFARWRADMGITADDKRWAAQIEDYIAHREHKLPPAGKYNAGQKQFFWIMFYGGLGLLLSGLALWFTEYIPWSLRWLRYGAILVHVVAFLATVAGFIVHVYMGVFVVKGGLPAMTTGKVTRTWAEHHHALWAPRE